MRTFRSVAILITVLLALSGCLFYDIYDEKYGAADDFKVLITADANYFYLATYAHNTLTDNVSDEVNHTRTRIERISLVDGSGFGTIYAGSIATSSPSSVDGVLTSAQFKNIQAMTFAADKNSIFIVDDAKLRKLELGSGNVSTLVSSDLTNAQGVAYSSSENLLYISQGSRIRKINLTDNSVVDFVGDAVEGDLDDTGLNARLSSVGAILLLNDNLYILDVGNNKIKKVSLPSGEVVSIAGSGVAGGTDGIADAATVQLTSESQISHDSKQMIFFTEFNGIRSLHLETKKVNTVLPFSRSLFDGVGPLNEKGGIYRPSGLYYLNKILYAVNPYGIKSLE